MLFLIKICWQTKLQLCFFIKKTELLSKQSCNLPIILRAASHIWRPGSKFVYMLGEKLTYFCQPHILPKVLGTVGFKLILKFWVFFLCKFVQIILWLNNTPLWSTFSFYPPCTDLEQHLSKMKGILIESCSRQYALNFVLSCKTTYDLHFYSLKSISKLNWDYKIFQNYFGITKIFWNQFVIPNEIWKF